jgi:hypothetical protein
VAYRVGHRLALVLPPPACGFSFFVLCCLLQRRRRRQLLVLPDADVRLELALDGGQVGHLGGASWTPIKVLKANHIFESKLRSLQRCVGTSLQQKDKRGYYQMLVEDRPDVTGAEGPGRVADGARRIRHL